MDNFENFLNLAHSPWSPDFVVDPFVLEDLKCSNLTIKNFKTQIFFSFYELYTYWKSAILDLIEDFRLVELDQVMDDHVRGPNMLKWKGQKDLLKV